jgi:hypothetical protein
MRRARAATAAALVAFAAAAATAETPARLRFEVRYKASLAQGPLDGRLLVLLSTDPKAEPRFQIRDTNVPASQQVFGIDVDGWKPGEPRLVDGTVLGFPAESLAGLKPGRYHVQALLHRYETFRRGDGHVVKLPMDRGEGQQWNRAPGNLLSAPRELEIDPAKDATLAIELDQAIPEIKPPSDTRYVKHVRIQSERLTKFWGRPMHLGAVVLVPHGFEEHPQARYPLAVFHGHFPHTFGDFREQPPDANLACEYSDRFRLECYNRVQQQLAHELYKDWTSPGFPRFLVVEIQHANPYYDDSYAVNSQNLGPYGDAIQYELIPEIEKRFRGIGQGWARFTYGGSTGGWEALAVQVLYPDEWNGAWASCPDPIDFRAYMTANIYEDKNAYFAEGPFGGIERPGHRNWLGHVSATIRDMNLAELVLGTKSRSGGQFDIWEAVYAPVGSDGYPKRIWDKKTGVIDPSVAQHLKENYDLGYILKRDWSKGLGKKLEGKIAIYCGDMDNYYLNNAVYLVEEFLKSTSDPPYRGEVAYGDRAEHCWNGDPTRPNAYSRLRYVQMHAPKMLKRIEKSAPPGADLTSWRY